MVSEHYFRLHLFVIYFKTVCTDYWYGDVCDKSCNCKDEPCNKTTGHCTTCLEGWTGDACDSK